jgi:hypothetical protein
MMQCRFFPAAVTAALVAVAAAAKLTVTLQTLRNPAPKVFPCSTFDELAGPYS